MRKPLKILWFPRLQFDVDKLHITTWREMCGALERKEIKVKIAIAGNDNNTFNRPYIGISIIKKKYLRILSFWINGYLKFIKNYLIYKPDVVILDSYSIWFSFPFKLFPTRGSIFIVDNRTPIYNETSQALTLKDIITRKYTKLCYQYCKLFLDGITVITDHYKHQICKDHKFDSSTVGVWGSGVDLDKFSVHEYKNSDIPSLLKGKFVLMQHGEISYNRGLFETIKAMSIVNRDDVSLVLIGNAIGSSKAKDVLVRMIQKLNLEKNVHIFPPVPHSEIPKYISYSDCAVMAYPNIEYWNNNNPIKLLEYLAMGKVVICTDMWTFRNVGGDSNCVYYIKDNNPETIAKAINYCCDNKMLLSSWGIEGVEIVKKEFTWNAQAKNLLDFIGQLQKNLPRF